MDTSSCNATMINKNHNIVQSTLQPLCPFLVL